MYDNAGTEYRRVHSPRRRAHSAAKSRGTATSARCTDAKKPGPLAVCLAVLAFTVVIHFVFPHFSRAVGDKVSTVVDYRTAFAMLGEGVSGERRLGEALTEAWAAAFRIDDADNAENVVQLDATLTPEPTAMQSVEATPGIEASDDAAIDVFAPDEALPVGEAEIPTDAGDDVPPISSFAEAAMAAFSESQYGYADYMMPAGVSYDMPTIEISGRIPVDGVVSSGFGFRRHPVSGDVRFHHGTDIAAPKGTPIYAFADGMVTLTGESATLGIYIIMAHSDSVSTTYGHCGEVFFSPGDIVAAGDKIATVSSTGNATGNCLHFELKVDGVCVNPEFYVQWA